MIPYNLAAIRLYERNGFERVQELEHFYKVGEVHYNAYLYAYFLNGGQPPFVRPSRCTLSKNAKTR